MLATAMVTVGALGPAATAHAADTFLALAYQPSYEVDAKVIYGQAHGLVFDTARVNALNDCQKNGGLTGGGQCEVRVVANNECAAIAAFRGTKIGTRPCSGISPPRPPTTSSSPSRSPLRTTAGAWSSCQPARPTRSIQGSRCSTARVLTDEQLRDRADGVT